MTDDSVTEKDQRTGKDIPGANLLVLSVISAAAYAGLAFLVIYFLQDRSFAEVLSRGLSLTSQLWIGFISGIVCAALIAFVIKKPPVADVLDDFYIVRLISETELTSFDRTQLSLFAGAGEELLFRGAVQPVIGIWLTSIIFVGLHGYFKFKSMGHIVFGAMMFGLSTILGYLFEYAGLAAAMSAHAVYDMIMLWLVKGFNHRDLSI